MRIFAQEVIETEASRFHLFTFAPSLSACRFTPTADIRQRDWHVCFGAEADNA
jgi:hypothetical protein